MTAHLKVIRAGRGSTIQDSGRILWRRFGVTPSGPMDWTAFQTVQQVLGNPKDAAISRFPSAALKQRVLKAPSILLLAGADSSGHAMAELCHRPCGSRFVLAKDWRPNPAPGAPGPISALRAASIRQSTWAAARRIYARASAAG